MAEVRYLRKLPKLEALAIANTSFRQALGYQPENDFRRRCNQTATHQLAVWLDKAEALRGC